MIASCMLQLFYNKTSVCITNSDRLTISGIRGSSGLGCVIRYWMDVNSPSMVKTGFHEPLGGIFNISKQILPAASTFGW